MTGRGQVEADTTQSRLDAKTGAKTGASTQGNEGSRESPEASDPNGAETPLRAVLRIPLWLDLRHVPVNKRLGLLHAADEMAAEHVLLEKGDPHVGREGLHALVVDGHHHLKDGPRTVGRIVKVRDAKSQARAAEADGIVVVESEDWRVIPLENLIAARADRPGTLFALAKSPQEAALFSQALETGVHGIVLAASGPADLFEADRLLRATYKPTRARPPTIRELADEVRRSNQAGQQGTAATNPSAAIPGAGIPAAVIHSSTIPSSTIPSATIPSATIPSATIPSATLPTGSNPRTASAETAPVFPKPTTASSSTAPSRTAPFQVTSSNSSTSKPTETPGSREPLQGNLQLHVATVKSIADGGMGDRVCVDCTSLFADGEGLLVGSTARSFILVHAETPTSGFVAPRPFRVNAGAVHSYLLSRGGRTRYLSELRAGDEVLAVTRDGKTRTLTVGRSKVEQRPHTLVSWRSPQGEGMAMLQTAETIRLVRPDGTLVSVTALKVGDQILVHAEQAARHFGIPIEESLEER